MDDWISDGLLEELVLFTRIVDHGGFTAASRATGVPQTSLSRRLAALERRLGLRLLQRSTRRSRVTEAGQRAYEHGRRIMEEAAAARAALAQAKGGLGGTVRLSAPVVEANKIGPCWAWRKPASASRGFPCSRPRTGNGAAGFGACCPSGGPNSWRRTCSTLRNAA